MPEPPRTVRPGPGSVGHIAPDPEGGQIFNTLVIRPQYRIKLRLGKLDDLFADDISTPAGGGAVTAARRRGRSARLQALGYFVRPLNHAQSQACYDVVWDHYRNKIHQPPISDVEADKELLEELERDVVKGGRLPIPGAFAKIRQPGGYTFSSWWAAVEPSFEAVYVLGADPYAAESTYFADNDILGKVPIVAKVEKYTWGRGWVPAAGASVYFQLRKPDDLPPFNPAQPCASQFNAPPLRESIRGGGNATDPPPTANGTGPQAYVNTHVDNYQLDTNPDPELRDPQVDNVHVDKGGKRGTGGTPGNSVATPPVAPVAGTAVAPPVGGVMFETTSRPGFHTAHPGRPLGHANYNVAAAVAPVGDSHKHAVRAVCNDEGEAGVIFMPSRCGGDRYKLRGYVGPPTLDSDGTEGDAVVDDTGSMVIWRTIRLSRYLRKPEPSPAAFPASVLNNWNTAPYNLTVDQMWRGMGLNRRDGTHAGLGIVDTSPTGVRDAAPWAPGIEDHWEGPARAWAKAFCELNIDPNARMPEELTSAELRAALNAGIANAQANQGTFGANFNFNQLIFHDPSTPFLINIRSPQEYNARPGVAAAQQINLPPAAPDFRNQIQQLVSIFVATRMLAHFTRNGLLPGLTLVHAPMGCIWDITPGLRSPTNGSIFTSGVALRHRGCFVFYGEGHYNNQIERFASGGRPFPYNLSSNANHEMGHNLYMTHQPKPPPTNGEAHQHDMADFCVMSYAFCEGQYCGKSLLSLRGLNIHTF